MPISKKISEDMNRASWIRRMFEEGIRLKKEFGPENVFDLSLGNPEIDPPAKFYEVLKKLVTNPKKGMHRYMPNSGYPETRNAIATQLNKESKIKFNGSNVVMTCGAAGGLNVVLKSILNEGEEVIILSPYFVEYVFYIDNHGLKCKIVETDENFLPDIEKLNKEIGPNTKALLINTPNNPTGVVYDSTVMKALSDLLKKKSKEYGSQIYLILDDAYHKLVYDGAETPCLFDYYPQSIMVASFSKTLSIPAERVGYIAVSPECADHDEIMGALAFCNRTLGFLNTPAIMQHIITEAADAMVDISMYQKKRDFIYKHLTEIGYEVMKPKGAFYIFPKTPIADDILFTQRLAKEKVLAVPGAGFGRPGYMRISFCVEDRVLEGAITGLTKAFGTK